MLRIDMVYQMNYRSIMQESLISLRVSKCIHNSHNRRQSLQSLSRLFSKPLSKFKKNCLSICHRWLKSLKMKLLANHR